jgi:hypothetical protein
MLTTPRCFVLLTVFLFTACANIPTGPSVLTLPGTGATFDQFRFDEYTCRQYAHEQVGGVTPKKAGLSSGAQSAVIGTALGAAAGAAFGGGSGAAIGAGAGLLGGGLIGSGKASESAYESQRRYDNSFIQCMYAKGHRVPVSGTFADNPSRTNKKINMSTPPAGYTPPPPPAGNPPPPPSK